MREQKSLTPIHVEKHCPKCGSACERDMVDVGIGEIPAGPWGCPECHWVEPAEAATVEGQ